MRRHIRPIASTAKSADEVGTILNCMRQIVRVLRIASRAAEKDVGLSGAQLWVLHKLAEGPALSLNELAERTHTDQSSVSVVVQRLVERGLVTRLRSGNDGRQIELCLTAPAKKLVHKAPGAAQDRLIGALERMPASQRRDLSQLLERLVDDLDLEEPTVAMFFEDPPAESPVRRSRNAGKPATGKIGASKSDGR